MNALRDEVAGTGQVHKLEPRAMRLLAVLAQAGGEVVLAEDLLSAVWPGLIVTPSSLYDAVAQLRRVLGPDHIATVPRKGYRLATAVMPWASAVAAPSVATEATPSAAPGPAGTARAETAEPDHLHAYMQRGQRVAALLELAISVSGSPRITNGSTATERRPRRGMAGAARRPWPMS